LRRRIGYVFQGVGLFPHMTVAENIGITPSLLKWDKPRIARKVEELLALVDLDPDTVRDRFPTELSGGQQQRIGVARALAAEPRVMLFDEPFGALDQLTRDHLQQSLLKIKKNLGLTAVFVTHDIVEAMVLGDRIAVLEGGRLMQVGSPQDLMNNPTGPYVEQLMETQKAQAQFVGEMVDDDAPDRG
jgi:osmoprotectant transport system ATP-binding protein